MKAFNALFKSEFILSLRDMNIPIFGIFQPIIVALVIGMVGGSKPAFDGAGYSFMEQSFGALASICICATGLMGMPLLLSDYRHRKILKRYMVTPVSPALLLYVQFFINVIVSIISLISIYIICSAFWDYSMDGNVLWFLLSYLLVIFSIYSIGMMLASLAPNMKTANLLCMLVYFPMLFFSGATIPYEIMPKGAQIIMEILPLTQGVKLLKASSLGLPLENVVIPIVILALVSVICTVLSIKFFRWE